MKIRFAITVVMLAAILSPAMGHGATDDNKRDNPRSYNCRMPRRDGQGHGREKERHPGYGFKGDNAWLFNGLGLSSGQYRKADKIYSSYEKDIRRLQKKMRGASPRRADKYVKEMLHSERGMIDDMRRLLNARQFNGFMQRFRTAIPDAVRRGADSAPRPGGGRCCADADYGFRLLADSLSRQECAGEQENGIGPITKGPEPRLVTREKN